MATVDIPLPFGGESQDLARVAQPPGTARTARNARGTNPDTGRAGEVSSRAGMDKACTVKVDAVGGGKVQDVGQITYDAKRKTYSVAGTNLGVLDWAQRLGGDGDCLAVVPDQVGNLYCVAGGRSVTKLNSAGKTVWTLTLEMQHPDHRCRAITIDEFGGVYVAVSYGGDVTKSRIWRYQEQDDDSTPLLTWHLDVGLFVEQMKIALGRLYTIQNQPREFQARIVVYSSPRSSSVRAESQNDCAYPVANFDVDSAGNAFVSSPPFAQRALNPRAPGFTPASAGWTPYDDKDIVVGGVTWQYRFNVNLWWWADIKKQLGFTEGKPVPTILDWTPNGRHLYANVNAGWKAAVYNEHGIGYRPSLRFDGATTGYVSGPNPGAGENTGDAQKNILPGYGTDSKGWCMILLLRPALETANPVERCVMQQTDANRTAGAVGRLFVASGSNAAGVATIGAIRVSGVKGAGAVDFSGTFNTNPPCVMVSIFGTSGATKQIAFRVNGQAIGADAGVANFFADGPTYFGRLGIAVGAITAYLGDFSEGLTVFFQNSGSVAPISTGDNLPVRVLEEFEGYMAHNNGIAHLLPAGHTYKANPPPKTGASTNPAFQLTRPEGMLAKYNATTAGLVWVATTGTGLPLGGVGHGVVCGSGGRVYTTGPRVTNGTVDAVGVRCLIDKGDSYSTAKADGAWSEPMPPGSAWTPGFAVPGSYDLDNPNTRLAVDTFDNVYVPYYRIRAGGLTDSLQVFVFAKGGQDVGTHLRGKVLDTIDTVQFPDDQQVFGVVCDPTVPPYVIGDGTGAIPDDFKKAPTSLPQYPRAEHVVLFTRSAAGGAAVANPVLPTVHRVRMVTTTSNGGSPRARALLAVSGGKIKRWAAPGTMVDPAGTGTLASPQLSAGARFISRFELFGKLYYVDGTNYLRYDPRTDVVERWTSRSSGKLPAGCELAIAWNGRAVLLRGESGYDWHMSRQGDPDDHRTILPIPDPQQAISAATSLAGQAKDLINTAVPWKDDGIIFGCDASIWLLNGDPAPGNGGVFDRVTDKIGMSYGKPWTTDPTGTLWFWASTGGLYRMRPGQMPEPVTNNTLDVAMSKVDLSAYHVRLEWESHKRMAGLYVKVCPFGVGGTPVQHWFLEARPGGPFTDTHGVVGNTGVQPTCIASLDGDQPDDRVVIVGCEDSYLRRFTPDAKDDDGVPIAFDTFIGPLRPKRSSARMRFGLLRALLAEGGGPVDYELFGSDTPDNMGTAKSSGTFRSNADLRKAGNVKGNFLGVRLFSARAASRVALSRLTCDMWEVGRENVE